MVENREWPRLTKQLLIGLAAHWLAASSRAAEMLDPQRPVGSAERLILLNATGTMLVVLAPVIVPTLGFAAMIVILLSGVAWRGSHRLDPGRNLAAKMKPLHVEHLSPST